MTKLKHYIIPIFVPHYGCKNDCVFCNQNKITGMDKPIEITDLDRQVKEYINWFNDSIDSTVEIAFYGGSFTGIDMKVQKELLIAANKWIEKGIVSSIRISTRPDYINTEILLNLKKYNVSTIELGVQSLDEDLLYKSKRGHSVNDVYNAVKLIKEMDFKLGLQMMIGLPGDTQEKSIKTAKKIIELEPNFVRIYPALIIKNTELESLYVTKKYIPLSLNRAVDICKDIYRLFRERNINIIRIGLQATDNIMKDKDLVAGPFHPSFRQLVESSIIKDHILEILGNINKNIKQALFYSHPSKLTALVGNRKSNISFIKSNYNINEIKIIGDKDLLKNQFKIIFDDTTYMFNI